MQKHMNKTRRGYPIRTKIYYAVIAYFCFGAFTLPVTYADTLQQAYLKASNTTADDNFGGIVAIDGNTAVVGAREAGNNATFATSLRSNKLGDRTGAAYVFVRSGDSWSQQAILKASNAEPGDSFGHSVAISGDTLVVSAESEESNATGVNGNQSDNSVPHAGAVYVFVRDGLTWSQQAYVKASNTGENDFFGGSLHLSGDTLVVGAHPEDSSASGVNGNQNDNSLPHSGAVYVFTRSGTQWSQQAYIKASNSDANDRFGQVVRVFDDTLVVSAPTEGSNATGINGDQTNNLAPDRGAVYVFTRNGTNWSQQAYIKASNSDNGGNFGINPGVSLYGDTLVVGSRFEPSNATGIDGDQNNKSADNAGAVYVFTRDGTTWSQQAYIKASNTNADDLFGFSVSVSGDALVVGAPGEDSGATGVNGDQSDNAVSRAGAAYLFTRNGAVWSQLDYFKASNTEANDNFGNAVAISGNTVVVAAIVEDSSATGVNGDQSDNSAENSGAAYVFDTTQTFSINAGHAGAWFNPETSGQGQFIDVEPGSQFMFVSWFTYTDAAADNPFEQRWLTAQGNYTGNTAELALFETLGGRFDDPQGVTSTQIGEVSLSFSDCGQGQMSYNIDEEGLQGEFPLLRVIPGSGNVCEERSGTTTQSVDINAGMDGAWFDPNTSGQGFFIDSHPDPEGGNFIFVSWFTYGDDTASGQRWLTAQGSFEGAIAEIDVFETTGGSFNNPQATSTTNVGTMSIDFTDCSNAQLSYSLPAEAAEGDIAITRVIPGSQALCEELVGAD